MSAHLPFDLLVDKSKIWQSIKFTSDNILDYLGKNLDIWLHQCLKDLGVTDSPMVKGIVHPGAFIVGRVYIAEGATVEPTAFIQGPCVIGPGAEIRHGAYIRGNVWIGAQAVVGHTTEVKGSVFFDDAKAGHFAYVGDSILGVNVNLGAGTKLANLKLRGNDVKFKHPITSEIMPTGLRKMGAIMGDHSQTGCNSVLSPGTILMRDTAVLPCVHFQGTLTHGFAR